VQIGISAGRSVGNAVKRNRAKRILRAAMNPLIDKLKPGREIILIARKPILKETSAGLQEIIKELAQDSSDLKKQ
jgi:ribonuclease P protein component